MHRVARIKPGVPERHPGSSRKCALHYQGVGAGPRLYGGSLRSLTYLRSKMQTKKCVPSCPLLPTTRESEKVDGIFPENAHIRDYFQNSIAKIRVELLCKSGRRNPCGLDAARKPRVRHIRLIARPMGGHKTPSRAHRESSRTNLNILRDHGRRRGEIRYHPAEGSD